MNGLARAGRLTAEEETFRRSIPGPRHVPDTARVFIERVDGYLAILEMHEIPCVTVRSADPGRIVYEDEYQVVVVQN
ncbi:hypothetical protein ACXIZN_33595 [Amycolatopsis sp. TRM77291]